MRTTSLGGWPGPLPVGHQLFDAADLGVSGGEGLLGLVGVVGPGGEHRLGAHDLEAARVGARPRRGVLGAGRRQRGGAGGGALRGFGAPARSRKSRSEITSASGAS